MMEIQWQLHEHWAERYIIGVLGAQRLHSIDLDHRRLGARSESVGQTALAAVLTVLVECHLND